jgi:hypothetical protein
MRLLLFDPRFWLMEKVVVLPGQGGLTVEAGRTKREGWSLVERVDQSGGKIEINDDDHSKGRVRILGGDIKV